MEPTSTPDHNDTFDLNRFLTAQEGVYERALAEIRNGQKRTHWMWYIFPQIAGLGYSSTAQHYAIKSRQEAQAYLHHPVLGPRLRESAEAVLAAAASGRSVSDIFGYPDDLKLQSCATLFASLPDAGSVFDTLLNDCFQGNRDEKTRQLLAKLG